MAWCFAGLAVIFASAFLLPSAKFEFYTGESGPIQVFSAAAYLMAVVALARETNGSFMWKHLYFAVIPIAMCFRELDFHNHFTTMSITRSTFFISPRVPLIEKAGAVLVYGVLVWCGVMLLRHAREFLSDLRAFRAYAVSLVLAGGFAVVSKAVDGIGRKLAPFGLEITPVVEGAFIVAEEVMELGIPVFFLVAVFAFFPARQLVEAGQGE